jgi:hypothetical protein
VERELLFAVQLPKCFSLCHDAVSS